MATDGTTPAPQVWPTMRARDALALIAFLETAFGFERSVVYESAPGTVAHAELIWPLGGGVMLGSMRDADLGEDNWPVQPGTFAGYVVTDAPDALFARATAAGAVVVMPLTDLDYGSRDFQVHDPEGNLWAFGTYRGHAWS
jgi:uncharacterized glyoxalase superfamily protein PhnB